MRSSQNVLTSINFPHLQLNSVLFFLFGPHYWASTKIQEKGKSNKHTHTQDITIFMRTLVTIILILGNTTDSHTATLAITVTTNFNLKLKSKSVLKHPFDAVRTSKNVLASQKCPHFADEKCILVLMMHGHTHTDPTYAHLTPKWKTDLAEPDDEGGPSAPQSRSGF